MTDHGGRDIGAGERAVLEIVKASELFARVGTTCVFDKGLSQARFNILIILKYYGHGGISQKQMLERMVSTKGNLSMHVKNLAAEGYIRKKTSKSDGRQDTITLTAKGARALSRMEPEYMRHVEQLTGDLSRDSAEHMVSLLQSLQAKCRAILGAAEDGEEN